MALSTFYTVAAQKGWTDDDLDQAQQTTVRDDYLYGTMSNALKGYIVGKEREANRRALGQLKNEIKLADVMMGNATDLRESIAKDVRSAHKNVTSLHREVVKTRGALSRARSPRSEVIASAARKAYRDKGTVASAAEALTNAYDRDTAGPMGRVREVELYNILHTVSEDIDGLFNVDEKTGAMSINEGAGLSPVIKGALNDLIRRANSAQKDFTVEQRNLNQSWDTALATAKQLENEANADARAKLAIQLESQLDKLMVGEEGQMGLVDRATAKMKIDQIEETDRYYAEQMKTYEFIGKRIRGGTATDQEAKAFSNPGFRQWAKENGFHLGYVTEDNVYIKGRDDGKAVNAWRRQKMRPNLRGSLSYSRFGSPGSHTGEFVSYDVKYSPEQAVRFQLDNGMYAYDIASGKGVTPAMAERIKDARNNRYAVITSDEGGTLLFDKQTQELRAKNKDGVYDIVIPPKRAIAHGVLIDVDGVLTVTPNYAGKAEAASVMGSNGLPRFLTEEDLLRDAEIVGSKELTAEILSIMPDIGEQAEPPGVYHKRGAKLKLHSERLSNPELAAGYVEIDNSDTGLRELDALSQIVGPVVVENKRSDDDFWTVTEAAAAKRAGRQVEPGTELEPPPEGEDSYTYGGTKFVTLDDLDAQKQAGNVWSAIAGWVSRDKSALQGVEEEDTEYEARDAARVAAEEAEAAEDAVAPSIGPEEDEPPTTRGEIEFEADDADLAPIEALVEPGMTKEQKDPAAQAAAENAADVDRVLQEGEGIAGGEGEVDTRYKDPEDMTTAEKIQYQRGLEKVARLEETRKQQLQEEVEAETGEGMPDEPTYRTAKEEFEAQIEDDPRSQANIARRKAAEEATRVALAGESAERALASVDAKYADQPATEEPEEPAQEELSDAGGLPSSIVPGGDEGAETVQATRASRFQRLREMAEKRKAKREAPVDVAEDEEDEEDDILSQLDAVSELRKTREARKAPTVTAPKPVFDPKTLDVDQAAKYLSEVKAAQATVRRGPGQDYTADLAAAQKRVDTQWAEAEKKRKEDEKKRKQGEQASAVMPQPFSSLADVQR